MARISPPNRIISIVALVLQSRSHFNMNSHALLCRHDSLLERSGMSQRQGDPHP